MNQQIVNIAEQLRKQMKKCKEKYSQNSEINGCYRLAKNLHALVKQNQEQREKLPDFFSKLHGTTIDMRLKLLDELKKQKQKNKQIEDDYENIVAALKNVIIKKDQGIKDKDAEIQQLKEELKLKDHQIKSKPKNQQYNQYGFPKTLEEKLREKIKQLQKYQKQCQEMRDKNSLQKKKVQILEAKLKQKQNKEQMLQNQLKKYKQSMRGNNKIGMSPSPDKIFETQTKTIYDNAFGSFSQIPIANFTSLQNTFSQQESDRKVRSMQSPFSAKNKIKQSSDEMWRFLYAQANAIEQFLDVNDEYNQ